MSEVPAESMTLFGVPIVTVPHKPKAGELLMFNVPRDKEEARLLAALLGLGFKDDSPNE